MRTQDTVPWRLSPSPLLRGPGTPQGGSGPALQVPSRPNSTVFGVLPFVTNPQNLPKVLAYPFCMFFTSRVTLI